MDALLIVCCIIISVFLFLVNFYILVVYSHPDDRGWGVSLFCRLLVIVGLTLSWAQVLMLPLDVSNSQGTGGGLDMQNFWIVIYMMIAIMVIFLMPTSIYVYESDEEKSICSRLCYAICLEVCTLIVVVLILFISWAYLKYAEIPFTLAAKSVAYMEISSLAVTSTSLAGQTNGANILEMIVSFPIYVICLTSFVGWWFFVLFGGVGLSALPMDLINEFLGRPVWRSSKDQAENKILLKKKTQELIEKGLQLNEEKKELTLTEGFWEKRKKKGNFKSESNKFKNAVYTLEKMHEIFKLELKLQDVNPLVYWAKLFLGLFFVVVSIIWWIHILVFICIKPNGIPLNLFLNSFLIDLQNGNAGFIATLVFAFLSLYLLWCTTKGNFKFGVRVPFIFTIHPMKKNETWMNSFLFNILLILICSVSVTQFCTNAFSQYARLTAIDLIFGAQVQYMKFFSYFFANNVFEYALLVWSALCAFYLIIKPSDKPEVIKEIERIKKQKRYNAH